MIEDILKTYKVLISCSDKMPGMKFEDAFPKSQCLGQLKKEMQWLETNLKKQ